MDIKVLVATHENNVIMENQFNYPIFVGSALSNLSTNYQRDDTGDNISNKNKYYCELTGLYWAYKNLKADYIGLCHYRRYFDLKRIDITKYDVILPKKRHYFIETVKSQFEHAHGNKPLLVTRNVINDLYPNYLESYDICMSKRSLHICNMFVMKYEIFIDYCSFLFNVLSKVEESLGNIERIYGFIGERLLDVYLYNKNYNCIEIKTIKTYKINWVKKIKKFLKRKYGKEN